MNRKLPPNLYQRQYRTRGGYKQTLFYVRFKDWKGKRRTFPGLAGFDHAKTELLRLKYLNSTRHDFDLDKTPAAPPTTEQRLFHWIDKFLAIKKGKKSAERDRFSARWLKDFFGDCPLEDLIHTRLLAYRNSRTAQGREDSTINREMSFLRSVLNVALKDGSLTKLPRLPFVKEENERTRTVSANEYAAILTTLGATWPDTHDVVVLLKETGFRVGEVLALTVGDLDPANHAVDVNRIREKGGLKRVLPQSPAAWAILSARGDGKAGKRLFPGMSRHMVHKHFLAACAALNIKGLWVHDLRATFATFKERERRPRKLIMEFTGHRTEYAFRRYSRPTLDDLRDFIGSRNGNETQEENESEP